MAEYRHCEYCGGEFILKAYGAQKFCSQLCFQKYEREHIRPIIVKTKHLEFMVSDKGVFDLWGNEIKKKKETDWWSTEKLKTLKSTRKTLRLRKR